MKYNSKTIHFFKSLICLCLIVSHLGVAPILQSVAWTGMVYTYSIEENSFLQGLNDTFSGEKPCDLCCAIDKTKNNRSEKQQDFPLPSSKDQFKEIKNTNSIVIKIKSDYSNDVINSQPSFDVVCMQSQTDIDPLTKPPIFIS
jgi:hypothetical protein